MKSEIVKTECAIEERTEKIIANEINYIKRRTCETVLSASVEIGRLLCEAKTKVESGEWMRWLSENVNYSQSTANNLMRLYEEYGEKEQLGFFEENRIEIFGDISPSQALALIALPYAERKEFIRMHDMSETSVRDINAEIKALRDEKEQAEKELAKAKEIEKNRDAEKEEYLSEIEDLKKQIEQIEAQQPDIDGLSPEREAELNDEKEKAVKQAKEEIKSKYEKKLNALKEQTEKAEKEKETALQQAKDEAYRSAKEEYQKRLDTLTDEAAELKRKAEEASNGAVQKFAAYFELMQSCFASVLKSVREIGKTDKELERKLTDGLRKSIDQMTQTIG